MNSNGQFGILISLAISVALLGACAPIEQKPQLTAPQNAPQSAAEKLALSEAIIAEETKAKEAIAAEIAAEEKAVEEVTAAPLDDLPSDETTVLAVTSAPLAEDAAPEDETAIEDSAEEVVEEVAEEAIEETPPPPPPPFDPVILVGEPLEEVEALFGSADLAFDNGGLRISHYRGEACLMLVFSSKADSPMITHIDLRAPILGTAYDRLDCHDELGRKKR